ncbi:MAG: hypothetical protein AB7O26_01695 [Planctomycetaceae bacterium]
MSRGANPLHAAAGAETRYDWIASLAFWLCLVAAAGLFASVTLAPRLAAHLELKEEYQANQIELVGMESRMQYLEKVAEALKNDPQFAAEVARIDFDAARPGDERIAVDKTLSLSAPKYDPPALPEAEVAPWYAPIAETLARSAALRPLTLLVAAALVVVAFTFLHDAPATETDREPARPVKAKAKRPKRAA